MTEPDPAAPSHARGRLAPDRADARFLRRVLMLLIIGGVALALWRALDLLILAFGAILGAIAIHALADLYARYLRVGSRLALAGGMITALGFVGFLIWLFAVGFREQVNQLITQSPVILNHFAASLSHSPVGAKIVDAARQAYAGSQAARDVGGLLRGAGELLLNFILLVVGALFFAADPHAYERGLLLLAPPRSRAAFADAFSDLAFTLKLWLRAELIQMTTMGVQIGVGLWISGVPSPAPLGLLAGLSEFIPYVGPTAAMLPALGLAATQGSGPVLGALATYAVVRLIQTNFITPYVNARVIDIPPAMTVFAIIGIGYVFGLFGLFFSAAMLVTIYSLVRTLYLREVLGEDIPHLGPRAPEPSDSR